MDSRLRGNDTNMEENQQPIESTEDASAAPQDAQVPASDACLKCEEYLSGWKRAQADYANLKRESELARSNFSKYANERLIESLLPGIEQYDMAMHYIPDVSGLDEATRKPLDNWLAGLKAVRSSWASAFQEIGLEKVPTDGNFDPLLHEAVAEEESELPPSKIVRVMQDGWRLNGKLLRPARVIIAK